MASFGKQVFFFFFLVIFSCIQARESTFFSKFTHYSITKNNGKKESTISSVPIQAPTLAPAPAPAIDFLPDVPLLAPAPAPVLGEIENGYGLFGEGSGTSSSKETSTTTTTTAVDENELLNEELDGVPFDKKYENSNNNNNGYTSNYNNNGYKVGSARYETGNQNNNGYTSNYNNNGYKVGSARYESGNQNNNGYTNNYYNNGYKLAGESYETENQNSENGYTKSYNNNGNTNNNNYNNNGYTTNYNNNGYETERQGMSDTRFMEGGKYYYHVKNTERQGMSDTRFMEGGKYYSNVKNTERQGMSDTRFMEGGKYYSNVKNENYYPANEYVSGKVSTQNQGSYGNDENPNEFNTMEEYESQEGYEESQEESLPWILLLLLICRERKVKELQRESLWYIFESKAKLWGQIINFPFHVSFSYLVLGLGNIFHGLWLKRDGGFYIFSLSSETLYYQGSLIGASIEFFKTLAHECMKWSSVWLNYFVLV